MQLTPKTTHPRKRYHPDGLMGALTSNAVLDKTYAWVCERRHGSSQTDRSHVLARRRQPSLLVRGDTLPEEPLEGAADLFVVGLVKAL